MIVEVKQGYVEGLVRKSILTGNEYSSFLGIPYAEPPVGDLRFQPPQPIEKWEGTLKAFEEGSPCIQKDFFTGEYLGSEDCLYLNVYTPKPTIEDASKKAVMVFIHGGGFFQGSGSRDLLSADYLINYDIILVTFNYRLHVLGFLDIGAKNYVGNFGMRDQNLALKWVKENIEKFGGDSENITIFGESAGGCSVYFHLLSPLSKGLFNKAIIQSDPTFGVFKNGSNAKKLGLYLAKKFNNEETDPDKLIEFFKNQSAKDLCKHAASIIDEAMKKTDGADSEDCFAPSIEFQREDGFLPDTFENLMKTALPVPLIIGITNKEGRLAFPFLGDDLVEELQDDFKKVIKRPKNMDSSRFEDVCNQLKDYYLGDQPVCEETVDLLADLFTDYWFRNFYESIDFVINSKAPIYIYEFCFHGKFNVIEKMILKDFFDSTEGACHGDDLSYLFYPQKLLPELKEIPEPEKKVIQNMCSLWTNFAKYGNPSQNFKEVEWRRFIPTEPCYLQIDKNLKLVEEKLRQEQFEFWATLSV